MKVILAMTARERGGVWRHLTDLADGLRSSAIDVDLAFDATVPALVKDAEARRLSWMDLGESVRAPADVWHLHLHDTFERRALALLVARVRRGGARIVTEHLPHTNASDPFLMPGRRRMGSYG